MLVLPVNDTKGSEAPRFDAVLVLFRFCSLWNGSIASVSCLTDPWLLLCSSHHQGHQLHFDLDESRAAAGRGLIHPLLSTVLFLSEPQQQQQQQQQEEDVLGAAEEEDDPSPQPQQQAPGNELRPSSSFHEDGSLAVPSGSGATLVTNQRLGDFTSGLHHETADDQQGDGRCMSANDEDDCSRHSAWLIHPKKNRLLVFDGGLLHGVLPPSTGNSSTPALHQHRGRLQPETQSAAPGCGHDALQQVSRDWSSGAADAAGRSNRAEDDAPDRRITLMMAWHRDTAEICDDETRMSLSADSKDEDTEKVDGTCPRMGPLRKLRCTDPWVDALSERGLFFHQPTEVVDRCSVKEGQGNSHCGTAEGQRWWVPEELGPLWVDLRTSGVADGEQSNQHSQQANAALGGAGSHEGPGVDGLRFFLQSLKDLDRLYLYGGSSLM